LRFEEKVTFLAGDIHASCMIGLPLHNGRATVENMYMY